MQTPTNINWLQIVQLLAMGAAFAGISISQTQITEIAAGVGAMIAVGTMIIHTFFNHSPNGPIAKAINEAWIAGKNGLKNPAPLAVLLAFLIMPVIFLGGCSQLSNFFSNASTPIGDGGTVISGLQVTYLGLCPAGSTVSYCISSKGDAKSASAVATLTMSQLVSAYETGGNVTQLESQLLTDITQWDTLINDLSAKAGRKADILSNIVTILGVVIPVGQDIYNAIQQAAGNYSNAQLNTLVQTIESQNAQIQAL